ncbi:conserved Plasmodium protein, unknown function [Plasmodium knowlesi strain H]|uniref:Uncharacterized protein n=3 Tax=Plasmodium knowlesi TaxID=5850 RepID=A0A5K1V0G3_PLAKH|nr:conserved Plasmodium protein, unknown function [Plasmodium knowlesi strain H]OTN64563.1 Uncharacterized protein PKNOH_S130204000 [Plasmodium knowlesi]CAA9989200.1 conserved Plasmodium protein, unknown function [Plasmodium knowlesi strain H]SBO27316.1 conserved Plasmodium protein, unknown function [Plasmodium knowlesi strain H]SBO27423.1 conserved Plasmodium protein, unknown function [Plasmodium knowlesi strain H]VVS78674.1 conserved Plasmodium protein, unknown function [Plasmodium knowlesi |eukprot:XP_002261546.1 hypothetical protein, conserved in Plasmodium species [Plasmodium knowlesi strain H]
MSKTDQGTNLVEETYLSSIRRVQESIERKKHTLREDNSIKISFKECDYAIKKHTNAVAKMMKDASHMRGAASTNISEYYSWLIKCDSFIKSLTCEDINMKINEMFDVVIAEINSRCKPVLL